MAGFLLARAGVDVLVLEKHGDFLRDFRGDTVHPSTLEILDELGLANRFLAIPHSELPYAELRTTTGDVLRLSFQRLRTRFPFVAQVPQWDFLNFITGEARKLPTFRLRMNAPVDGLIEEDGVVRGVRIGDEEIRALLTIGADGRSSRTREAAGLPRVESSPPMDVFWFRLPRYADEEKGLVGRIGSGIAIVLIDRRDYWQVAYIIPKGAAERVRSAGLASFQRSIVSVVPQLEDRVDRINDWEQVKLLTVRADRLTKWFKPGFLAIGDAAHAMSPIGGVGINLAIHDGVEAANVLWKPLLAGRVTLSDLARVQRNRQWSVRIIQRLQSAMQEGVVRPALQSRDFRFPWFVRAAMRIPIVRDIPPRLMAFGIRRPHVRSPAL
jgi:2-polyprenyl-6-methoxyphenol hydroxylase-like FAD-dependent oxidoreductase